MKLRTVMMLMMSVAVCSEVYAHPKFEPNVYDNGNLWTITFYNDNSVDHTEWATQRICFSPYVQSSTQILGTWYSTTFPNWHGHYSQEGDSVKMTGNFSEGRGNDAMQFDIVTGQFRTLGAGHWVEFGDNGMFGLVFGFGNAVFHKVGKCTVLSTEKEYRLDVQPRMLEQGREAQFPMQSGQYKLPEANQYESLESIN